MIYPQEKIEEIVKLGPVKASELLDRARAGDLEALADWSVYAIHSKLRRDGASPVEALHHTRVMMANVDLRPKVSL